MSRWRRKKVKFLEMEINSSWREWIVYGKKLYDSNYFILLYMLGAVHMEAGRVNRDGILINACAVKKIHHVM